VGDNVRLSCSIDPRFFAQDDGFEQWCQFSFNRKMIELYGEASRLTKLKEQKALTEDIMQQWSCFDRLCSMTLADANTLSGEKEALHYSWLEMKDYIFSDNPAYSKREQVMKWFDQWMDIRHLQLEKIVP
jgi:hypothetical protein